jgi:asparagine synthase (glutamine-hydrolysing)
LDDHVAVLRIRLREIVRIEPTMCGIAGILDFGRPPLLAELKPMVRIQRHRGPDDVGFLVDGSVAMGMARLSIIDLPGGKQPITNEDGSIVVVLNGEIYNYIELRDWLVERGHRFSTQSDTEVLVHLYEEHGTDMLSKLNGMFAFSIWDKRKRSLFIARDRMGIKPLYYAQVGSRWLFASELKALQTQREFSSELDLDAIADFLRLSYIPREATPYRASRRLLPGHYLLIKDGSVQKRAWWNLNEYSHHVAEGSGSMEQLLEQAFDDSVRLCMRSDVPVASFLSGGLDSSLVTATAQRLSGMPIRSFTVGFEHTEFDETAYARSMADHAHTVHQELHVQVRDAVEYLPRLLWHMDEPLGDSSIIPNYLISRFAGQEVKVCLSGLGGDELFGGYARYLDPGPGRIRRVFRYAPAAARALAPLVKHYSYPWADELDMAGDPSLAWKSYLKRVQVLNSRGLKNIGFAAHGRAPEIFESLWKQYSGKDSVSRFQYIDQHTYLPDQILALTDRMSMANSLEVRVPFLDYHLVQLAGGVPGTLKQNTKDFKILLKRSLGNRCRPEILNRRKFGFDTPLRRWVKQPEIFELLKGLPEGIAVRKGLFDPRGIKTLVADAETASRSARRVWNLFVLDIWLQVNSRATAPRETLSDLAAVAA